MATVTSNNTTTSSSAEAEGIPWHVGFAQVPWQVHKFGGTSVANAECFLRAAAILEEQLSPAASGWPSTSSPHHEQDDDDDDDHGNKPTTVAPGAQARTMSSSSSSACCRLAVVVSAMGGKPKVTDLLLNTVQAAAQRQQDDVRETLDLLLAKHVTCLQELFPADDHDDHQDDIEEADHSTTTGSSVQAQLIERIQKDIEDIYDILKTVSLMKWKADRISELVSGYGELWSAQILTAVMKKRFRTFNQQQQALFLQSQPHQPPGEVPIRHEFIYLDARRVITVDEDAVQNGAIVWDLSQQKLESFYAEQLATGSPDSTVCPRHVHLIVTGYVASNTQGVSTTLQRDGSDYSAAIMGRLLRSNTITIWTDVNGVMSADPRRVPAAQVVAEVSYNEAMELAYFGAKVIHPKTMQPAIAATPHIPIYIRNTFNSAFRGTRIYQTSTTPRDLDRVVCGFSSIDGLAVINVEGSGMIGVRGVDRRLFAALERIGVNVYFISQASSEHSVTVAIREDQALAAKEAIEDEFSRELKQSSITNVDLLAPCSIIAAVGDGMSATAGVSGRFFSALGDAKINVVAIAQGCSERNISAVVSTADSTRALRAVHAAFRLSHTTIRVALVGMNEVGDSLLKLLESQRSTLRATFDIDLQVCVVMSKGDSDEMVALKNDHDGGNASITIGAFNQLTGGSFLLGAPHASFHDESDVAMVSPGGLATLAPALLRNECTNHVIFDCTNEEAVGKFHADWLRAGIDVVSANNTGLSGPRTQRDDIRAAEKAHGKQSALYLREVTVGGGLPIINTLRSLLHSGDSIRRIDGILSVSLSFILFRVSPPPDFTISSEFDEISSKGAFRGDLSMSPSSKVGTACSFSEAVKEAIALGLMEEDPTKDLNNEYTSRVLMVLAGELGMDEFETSDIQRNSAKLLEVLLDDKVDYSSLSKEIDGQVKKRVDAARSRGCVLRQISSVDVRDRTVEIKIVEVPEHHIFAVTPPSCECVRFFTHRHRRYPLIVQGPSAGADSTASALLAELLQFSRGKSNRRTVALSRTGSAAQLAQKSPDT